MEKARRAAVVVVEQSLQRIDDRRFLFRLSIRQIRSLGDGGTPGVVVTYDVCSGLTSCRYGMDHAETVSWNVPSLG